MGDRGSGASFYRRFLLELASMDQIEGDRIKNDDVRDLSSMLHTA